MRAVSRRSFLKQVLHGAGLTLAIAWDPLRIQVCRARTSRPRGREGFRASAWLEIAADETVTVVVAQSEMGQGITTALPMVVAEELDADWSRVRFVQAPAADEYVEPRSQMQFTGGSQSMRTRFEAMREAGATARRMLIRAAARLWRVREHECDTMEGRVVHRKSARTATYGSLAALAARERVPLNPPRKAPDQFRLIGRETARLDIPEKVRGIARFGMDTVLPGMCCAVVAHSPRAGARLVGYDLGSAAGVPGVFAVVRLDDAVAVCAESIEAALRGRQALRVSWDDGSSPRLDDDSIERALADALERPGKSLQSGERVSATLDRSNQVFEATYRLPFLAHAAMEPMACVAHVQPDRCDLYGPTQAQTGVRAMAARVTGLPVERVHVHTTYLSGAFGRYNDMDFLREAVLVSKAVRRPVLLVWTREEDMANDFFRPASASRVQAGLDTQGRITAWRHRIAAPSIAERVLPMWRENGMSEQALERPLAQLASGVDHFGVEGLDPFQYVVPHVHYEFSAVSLPVRVGLWRAPGHNQNAFAIECFMDELARAARADPVEFRLRHLAGRPRERRVLEMAADRIGWGRPRESGRAVGVARYSSCGSHAAHAVEVSVDLGRGALTVHRVVVAFDCGRIVNPDTVRAQLEGSAILGLGSAMFEEVRFEHGKVATTNFDTYRILRMSEAPEIEVCLVRSDEPVGGAGEPGLPSVAPALANAVFEASGLRIRRLPLVKALRAWGTEERR